MRRRSSAQIFPNETYVFEGLSAFRSKDCMVGVVVEGVDEAWTCVSRLRIISLAIHHYHIEQNRM